MMNVWTVIAMAPPAGAQGGGNPLSMFAPMLLIFGIFYFMLIRPQQRKERERREMIENVKTGERVVFCGGMMGTVTNVKDGTFTIKIAENVKVEVARAAVSQVLEKGEKVAADEKA